jgi:hypothetical protein
VSCIDLISSASFLIFSKSSLAHNLNQWLSLFGAFLVARLSVIFGNVIYSYLMRVFRMVMLWISLVARGTVAAEWSWHTSISLKSFFGEYIWSWLPTQLCLYSPNRYNPAERDRAKSQIWCFLSSGCGIYCAYVPSISPIPLSLANLTERPGYAHSARPCPQCRALLVPFRRQYRLSHPARRFNAIMPLDYHEDHPCFWVRTDSIRKGKV